MCVMSATLGEVLGSRIAALLSGGPPKGGAQLGEEGAGGPFGGTVLICSEGRSFPVALRYLGPPGDPFSLIWPPGGPGVWPEACTSKEEQM